MKKKGIALAGNIIVDVTFSIEVYPQKGNLTKMSNQQIHTGGLNNIVIDLAKIDTTLPLKASGLVGTDEKGQFVLEELSKYGNIDTSQIIIEGQTSVTYVMTEKTSKHRTFFYDPGTSENYNESHIDFSKLDADIFHLEYLLVLGELDKPDEIYGTKAAKLLCEAIEKGMETSIDIVSEEGIRYQSIVVPALQYTNYCVINEVEAEGITGISLEKDGHIFEENMWKALKKIQSFGVRTWVVIHSPKCSYGLNCVSGEEVRIESLKLPEGFIKGTVGAGDAYCAGVLYGAYKGLKIEDALKLATACAASSLSEEGSHEGVASYDEIMKLYYKLENKN